MYTAPPNPASPQFAKTDKFGNRDWAPFLRAQQQWAQKLVGSLNNATGIVSQGKPITVADVAPVTTISADMTVEELSAALCYIVTLLQQAGIVAKA